MTQYILTVVFEDDGSTSTYRFDYERDALDYYEGLKGVIKSVCLIRETVLIKE